MSRVDLLKNSRENSSVKFLEFTRIASKGISAAFFEGEDEKYYSVRINSIRPDIKWSAIDSGGKQKVIALRKKIRNHTTYSSAHCMFFVDADFDDNSEIGEFSDTYITPCYSVENLYISLDAYNRILSAEFGISDCGEFQGCHEGSISLFEDIKSKYIEAIRPFNCLIRELRHMEKRGDLNGRLNINNINFDNLIKIDLSKVEKLYDEKNPKNLFPELQEGIAVDLTDSENHFAKIPGDLWFRGKQNLEFFRIFLDRLKEDRCKKKDRQLFKEKGNVRLQTSKGNCISELSQYADTPKCLRDFLHRQVI